MAVSQLAGRPHVTRSQVFAYALSIATTLIALGFMVPYFWAVMSSLKTSAEVSTYPPRLIPKALQWVNFRDIWVSPFGSFRDFMSNSFFVTVLAVVGTIISSTLVAYGFARFRFPFKNVLFILVLSGLMMPIYVTIIPLFDMFQRLGWTNSFKGLVVPAFFGNSFTIFLLRQFILTIPYEFDEAAIIEGAGRLRILLQIIVPNLKPAVAAATLFAFRTTWNDFLRPLVFLDRKEKFTAPLGLYIYQTGHNVDIEQGSKDHQMMAAAVLTTLPILLLFGVTQKFFVRGVVMSGLKG